MTANQAIVRACAIGFGIWCVGAISLCVVICVGCAGCFPTPPLPPEQRVDGVDLGAALRAMRAIAKLFCVAKFVLLEGLYPFLLSPNQLQDEITAIDKHFAWLSD